MKKQSIIMKLRGILTSLLAGTVSLALGQNGMPQWIQAPPPASSTYYYRVSQGTGLTEDEADKKAFAMAVLESALAIGVPLDLRQLERLEGDSLLAEASRYVKIPINKVCKYTRELTTRRGYHTYILCQVAKDVHETPDFKSFNCILNKEE